jgi:hypothetical protein
LPLFDSPNMSRLSILDCACSTRSESSICIISFAKG